MRKVYLKQLIEELHQRYPLALFRNTMGGDYGSDCCGFASSKSDRPLINGLAAKPYYSLTWHYLGYPGNLSLSTGDHPPDCPERINNDWYLPIGANVRQADGSDQFVLFTIDDTVETLKALFEKKQHPNSLAIANDIIQFYAELRQVLTEEDHRPR